MSYQQLDKIADLFNPILALALIGAAFCCIQGAPWSFLLRGGMAVIVVQQLAKYAQKRELWGEDFPSTHFAVALALLIGFWLLSRKWGLAATVATAFYAVLMLVQRYHTPLEMVGAFFALPLALVIHLWPQRARRVAN